MESRDVVEVHSDNKWKVLGWMASQDQTRLLYSRDCKELSALMREVDCGTLLCASEKGALGERSELDVLAVERADEAPGRNCAVPPPLSPLGSSLAGAM